MWIMNINSLIDMLISSLRLDMFSKLHYNMPSWHVKAFKKIYISYRSRLVSMNTHMYFRTKIEQIQTEILINLN